MPTAWGFFRSVLTMILLAAALLSLPACNDGQAAAARAKAETLAELYAKEQAAKEADLVAETAKGDGADAAKVADLQKQIDQLASLKAYIDKAIATLKAAETPDTADDAAAAGSVGALLPPPWNTVALIGGPLVIGLVQELRKRNSTAAAVSIVNGITAASANIPGFREMLDRAKPVLKAEYTPEAKKLVDKHKLAKLPGGAV